MKLTDARSLVQVILPEARVSVRRTWSCYGAGWQKVWEARAESDRGGLLGTGTALTRGEALSRLVGDCTWWLGKGGM